MRHSNKGKLEPICDFCLLFRFGLNKRSGSSYDNNSSSSESIDGLHRLEESYCDDDNMVCEESRHFTGLDYSFVGHCLGMKKLKGTRRVTYVFSDIEVEESKQSSNGHSQRKQRLFKA